MLIFETGAKTGSGFGSGSVAAAGTSPQLQLGGLFAGGMPKLRSTGNKLIPNRSPDGPEVVSSKPVVNGSIGSNKLNAVTPRTPGVKSPGSTGAHSSIKASLEQQFGQKNMTSTPSAPSGQQKYNTMHSNKKPSATPSNTGPVVSGFLQSSSPSASSSSSCDSGSGVLKGPAPCVPNTNAYHPPLPSKPPGVNRSNSQIGSARRGSATGAHRPTPPPVKPPPPPNMANGSKVTPSSCNMNQKLQQPHLDISGPINVTTSNSTINNGWSVNNKQQSSSSVNRKPSDPILSPGDEPPPLPSVPPPPLPSHELNNTISHLMSANQREINNKPAPPPRNNSIPVGPSHNSIPVPPSIVSTAIPSHHNNNYQHQHKVTVTTSSSFSSKPTIAVNPMIHTNHSTSKINSHHSQMSTGPSSNHSPSTRPPLGPPPPPPSHIQRSPGVAPPPPPPSQARVQLPAVDTSRRPSNSNISSLSVNSGAPAPVRNTSITKSELNHA